jgi:hypothetical protein
MKQSLLIPMAVTALCVLQQARAADVFDASPEVRVVREQRAPSKPAGVRRPEPRPSQPAPENAARVVLKPGEVREILRSSKTASPELAFYLPPEATRVVQLVVEKRGFKRTYFLKALARGKTVGGAVERRWLDGGGFAPRSAADEARIQAAIKHNPLFIQVD